MKLKLPIIIILALLIGFNLYYSKTSPDKYTQAKTKYSSLIGSTSYLGRLDFWRLLVQLNQNQVADYKLNHQPEQLQKKIAQAGLNNQKNADDYIVLAKNQSLLGLNEQAIDSIKKAHQLDPIRSDIDKLFYLVSP